MNWDDLRIVLAVRDCGSYAKAAARLRLDETTIGRRLKRLQRDLGAPLFVAEDGLRKPTPECEAIAGHIEAITYHMRQIDDRALRGQHAKTRIRIACTAVMAEEVLAHRLADLLLQHPGLSIHFLTGNENVNFSRWEADIAIRLRKPQQGDFTIRRLGDIPLYFMEPTEPLVPAEDLVVCAYSETLAFTPEMQWIGARGLAQNVRCISDNPRVLMGCIQSQKAVGVLPGFLCRRLLTDSAFKATPLELRREAWLLIQNHLKDDANARLAIDWIYRCFADFTV